MDHGWAGLGQSFEWLVAGLRWQEWGLSRGPGPGVARSQSGADTGMSSSARDL